MSLGFNDKWQLGLFLGAALILIYQIFSGWRRGLMRQAFNMLGIVISYFVGMVGGRFAVPVLRPMGYPDIVSAIAGGAIIGLIVLVVVSLFGALLFKKTSQQKVWVVRFFYGVSGAVLGGIMGIVMIWVALIGTRLLGTIAESETHPARHAFAGKADESKPVHEPGAIVRGLADMKHSLDQSVAAPFVEKLDPVPGNVYSILGKVVRMTTDSDAMNRFVEFPGAKTLENTPALVQLGKDPEIVAAIRSGNYLSLLGNKHIAEVANDPKFIELARKFELEKALDYALNTGGTNSNPASVKK